MVGTAGLLCELQIADDGAPLALGADARVAVRAGIDAVVDIAAAQKGVVFAVRHEELAEAAAFFHRLAHQAFRLYAAPVVGEGHNVRGHSGQVGQGLPKFADGDGTVGVGMDAGVAAEEGKLNVQRVAAVRHGI